MTTKLHRLAVYCGSATPDDQRYIELARKVGQDLATQGIGIVYGGGRLGLMGALADAALDAGGEVIGVIPRDMMEREVAHTGCTKLHVVDTMHERKARFTALCSGFLTLPGGVGTMDELWEATSWGQLGYHTKPVGVLNAFGFYDHLLALHRHMVATGFIRPAHEGIIMVEDTLGPLLARMQAHTPHTPIFAMQADQL